MLSFHVGGDPGGDFHWSPLDPAFYLHHAQVDRLYFVWQNLDWENRQVRTTNPFSQIPQISLLSSVSVGVTDVQFAS